MSAVVRPPLAITTLVLAAGLAACAGPEERPDGGREMLPDRPEVGEDSGPDEGDCEPPYAPGEFRYTRTWARSELVGLALDSTGAALVGATFTGSVDVDPGPGVMTHEAVPDTERSFVVRLDPEGELAWAHVLDPALELVSLTATTENRVVLLGRFTFGNVTSFDFDPGPGAAPEAVRAYTQGMFVIALASDGTYLWSRRTGPASHTGAIVEVEPLPDGGVVVAGGAITLVGDPGVGPGGLLYLDRDGRTEALFDGGSAAVHGLAVSPDGTVATIGTSFFSWDADHTYGVDQQYTNAQFVVTPAYLVTQIRPDLSYGWTRSYWTPIEIGHVAIDGANGVIVSGGVNTTYEMPDAVDLDPGADTRWLRPGWWSAAFDDDGRSTWIGHPLAVAGRAMRGDARGFYTATNAVVEHTPSRTRHAAKIGAWDTDGHRRWWLTLGSSGDSMASELAVGAGSLRAVGGYFVGGIDHAFGGAPPDPHESTTSERPGDAFVTLFTDEGESAPRCSDVEREPLPRWVCPAGRPIQCRELHVDCGVLTNPCTGEPLDCGACVAPETCGGGGEANVCGRAAPLVVADGLAHPRHVAVDATHVYFTTYGDYGPIVVRTVPGADAGVTEIPVDEGMRLWRAPRDGGGAPEMLYEARARPTELVLGPSAVYVRTEASHVATGWAELQLVRIPKADPGAAAPFTIDGASPQLFGVSEGYLYASGETGVVRVAEDGAGPVATVIPRAECPIDELFFEGGEILYVCRVGTTATAESSVRSRPRAGGPETVRSMVLEGTRIHRVTAAEILISTSAGPSTEEWHRLPRDATATTRAERIGPWARYTHDLIGTLIGVDGGDQMFLDPGLLSADTDAGALHAIPVATASP